MYKAWCILVLSHDCVQRVEFHFGVHPLLIFLRSHRVSRRLSTFASIGLLSFLPVQVCWEGKKRHFRAKCFCIQGIETWRLTCEIICLSSSSNSVTDTSTRAVLYLGKWQRIELNLFWKSFKLISFRFPSFFQRRGKSFVLYVWGLWNVMIWISSFHYHPWPWTHFLHYVTRPRHSNDDSEKWRPFCWQFNFSCTHCGSNPTTACIDRVCRMYGSVLGSTIFYLNRNVSQGAVSQSLIQLVSQSVSWRGQLTWCPIFHHSLCSWQG